MITEPASQPHTPASSIKAYYLAILLILTFVAIASYIRLHHLNIEDDNNALLINVSGHQRALSLNVMLNSTLLVNETNADAQVQLQADLSSLVTQMTEVHNQLSRGMLPGNLSYTFSSDMQALYFEGGFALDKQVKEYLSWASRLSTAPNSKLSTDHPDYAALLAASPDVFKSLDNVVMEYEREIAVRTEYAKQHEIVFLLAVAGTAGCIMLYIFQVAQHNLSADHVRLRSEIDMHREAEQILLRNETLYRLLAGNLPNTGVLLFDREMRYLVVEGDVIAKAGFSKEDLEGKTMYEVLPPPVVEQLLPFYQAALSGTVSDFEYVGQDVIYHIHSVPIKIDSEHIIGGMLTMQDITQRKHAEAKLKQSENFIQQIAETIPDNIYIYDLKEHRNIYANHDLGTVLGYTVAEIQAMGQTFMSSIMHPADLALFREHVSQLSQTSQGDSLEFEYRMKSARGEWRWFNSLNTVFLRDSDGATRQILGVARNIDRRKKTEGVLEEREHIIQQIAATVPDIIYIYDVDRRSNIYANRPFGEAIGYDAESIAVMGDDFMKETMHPDDWARFAEHFANLAQAADNTVVEFEYRMKAPEGDWCWLNSRDIVFTRDSEGRVTQILGAARDITAWKKAQDALQESEERFRQIAETVRSAFCIISPDSRHTYYVSPAYETVLGHPAAEMYKDPLAFAQFIHPEDKERVLRERSQNLTNGTYDIEFRIIHPDGGIRWISSRAYPVVNQAGEVERVISVTDDITERKTFEKQAFTIAVEREHIRVLSRFIQDTSHDLRTPLTIMTTGLYLLRKLSDPAQQADRIDQIEKQMQHLNRIIGDLHQMSKLDVASQLQIESVDINRLIQDLSGFYQTSLAKKNQTLELNLSPKLPFIQADPEQIKNAFMNIIDNASLYMDVGGSIAIETSYNATYVIISIRDTGIGIASEHHQHIFERFYKVDTARTSGKAGPGLGLSMVKRIIENHSGMIEVESILGEGSVFRCYLPIIFTINDQLPLIE